MQLPEVWRPGVDDRQFSFLDNQYYQEFSDEILEVRDVSALLEETRVSTLKKLVNCRARQHPSEEGPAVYRNDAREQSLRVFLEQTSRPVAQIPRPKSAALARLRAFHRAAPTRPETAFRPQAEPERKSAPISGKSRRPQSAPTTAGLTSELASEGPLRVQVVDQLEFLPSRRIVAADRDASDDAPELTDQTTKTSENPRQRCLAGILTLLFVHHFAT